jgi:hypothetical protein
MTSTSKFVETNGLQFPLHLALSDNQGLWGLGLVVIIGRSSV